LARGVLADGGVRQGPSLIHWRDIFRIANPADDAVRLFMQSQARPFVVSGNRCRRLGNAAGGRGNPWAAIEAAAWDCVAVAFAESLWRVF
jgi:hypothetical protein